MKAPPTAKIVRFLATGALNSAFGYIAFALLTATGLPQTLAVAAAMVVGTLFNFVSYGTFVFTSLDRRRLPRFVLAYLCIYAANLCGLRALAGLHLNPYAAQLLLVAPLAVLAYVLNDRWVFSGN